MGTHLIALARAEEAEVPQPPNQEGGPEAVGLLAPSAPTSPSPFTRSISSGMFTMAWVSQSPRLLAKFRIAGSRHLGRSGAGGDSGGGGAREQGQGGAEAGTHWGWAAAHRG